MIRRSLVLLALVLPAAAVEVTVYNADLGLVKDTRPFVLKPGVNRLQVEDVAASIDPTSVHFRSLTAPDAVRVLEQDFRYDLASPDRLLERYLGREIELERPAGRDGERRETIRGVLLSNQGGRVLKSGGRILVNPPGEPVLPSLPEGLLTRPTLVWLLDARKGGEHRGEISYLTGGLSWSADYVLVADADDAKADLTAWVTVSNHSGATYPDARLKLVAGDVHRAPRAETRYNLSRALSASAPEEAGMDEQSFFEYHLYSLARPTTLADNSSKQVELTSAAGVPIKKIYVYDGAQGLRWASFGGEPNLSPGLGLASDRKVAVILEFRNAKPSGLGLPLPKGRVRVYKQDGGGSLQFAGEDALDHTPKDEIVRVRLGDAFDLVGERRRTEFSPDLKKRRAEESFEIRLRNHKDSPVVVTVVERLHRWSGWTIASASSKWEKKDARTLEFKLPVPKDGEAVLTYTVRYSW